MNAHAPAMTYEVEQTLLHAIARAICAADEAGEDTSSTDAVSLIAAHAAHQALLDMSVKQRMATMGMEVVRLVRPAGDGRAGSEVLDFWRPIQ